MAGGRDERVGDLFFVDQSAEGDPGEEGLVRYVNTDLKAYVGGAVVSLISGSGITESQHETLDTLIHDIDESSYDEIIYGSGNRVSSYIVWASMAKLLKIRDEQYTYTGGKVSQVVTKQYDATGAVKMTMTEVYTYSGNTVTSVTRTKS